MVEDDEIELALNTLGGNLPLAAEHLVHMSNDNGGRDNVSVALVKVLRNFETPKCWQRLLAGLK
jgi:protein phosphatase